MYGDWGSIVGMTGRTGVQVPVGDCLISRPAMGSASPPLQWEPALFAGDKAVRS